METPEEKRTVGRPSMSGDRGTSPIVQTRLPDWVKAELIAEAAELGFARDKKAGEGRLVRLVLTRHAQARIDARNGLHLSQVAELCEERDTPK